MKTIPLLFLLIIFTSFHQKPPAKWGFFGHKRINRLAVFTLPEEMLPLFKKEIEYLTEHSIDPAAVLSFLLKGLGIISTSINGRFYLKIKSKRRYYTPIFLLSMKKMTLHY